MGDRPRTGRGERRWLQLFLNPIELVEGTPEISAIAYDITERKRIDKAIRGALKEKEILLQEVHHRVKNNLQIINSILNLQKSFVNDEKAIEGLEEIQNRVSTMSIIHETLYQNTDVSSIGFPSYMERIAGNIIQGYQSRTRVELVTDLEDIQAPLDQAIPCGLILNEWVSNAMKYAFEGRENGTITVGLRAVEVEGQAEEEEIQIEVRDDGVGLPEGFDWSGKDSSDCTSFRRSASSWTLNSWRKVTGVRGFWLAFGGQKTCLTDEARASIERFDRLAPNLNQRTHVDQHLGHGGREHRPEGHEQTLEKIGYNVVASADNGEDAIDLAVRFRPDVVLMDIMLKGDMNGIAAAEEIKRTLDVPIIFLTAYADRSTLGEAKLAEPHGYILKPFKDVDLQTSIEMALHKFAKEQEARLENEFLRNVAEHKETAEYLFVKNRSRLMKIDYDELLFIEALKDYVVVHTPEQSFTIHSTMKDVENKLNERRPCGCTGATSSTSTPSTASSTR